MTQEDGYEPGESETKGSRRERSTPNFISSFTWQWFTCTMSTGSLAVVLFQTPYKFYGLVTAGKTVFIIDLILFFGFSVTIAARFALRTKSLRESLYDSDEAFFFGSFWVSLALILQNISQYGIPSCGPWLVKAVEVLFWMYLACIIVVAVLQYHTLFVTRNLNLENMTPAWLLPIYPLLVTGPLAAVVIQHQPVHRASPIWVAGVAGQGLGWMVTVFMYAMWAIRLLCEEIPAPSLRPGMYIAVGPTGYTVTGIVSLGTSASKGLPRPFLGQPPAPAAATINVIAVIVGTFLWLLAFWFFALSTVAIIYGSKRMTFNLTWWSFIFPNAGLLLATIQLGNAYDSPAVNYLCSVLTGMLFLGWLLVWVGLINAGRKGKLA